MITTTNRWMWVVLTASLVIALAVIAVPVWHIRPFRPQSPDGMTLSYSLRHLAPSVTAIAALAALAAAAVLAGRTRGWRRGCALALVLPALAAAWFARQNHFEWMFNPLPDAAYVAAEEAAFLEPDDLVLAVEADGEAVAYPVRLLAYHHIVNDVVGRTPLAATY